MGKYRSDNSGDEYSRKSKKKKKRKSRSGSSSSEHSHISDSKSKRSRKKHRRSSRSRSRSLDKRHAHVSRSSRRSRSSSLDRYGSRKPRSSDQRSSRRLRSPPSKRSRSRSHSSRRRRSHSRGRRSRSPSYERRRDSRSYSRERSHSGDRTTNSQRSSVDRRKGASQLPGSPKLKGQAVSESVPGFSDMTPAEQAEERLRLALKAAVAAGEKLKGHAALESAGSSLFSDSKNFASSVSAIESDSFVASSFRSSRTTKIKEEPIESGMTHDDAIFGSLAISGFTMTPDPDIKPIQLDPDSIMHPSLYCDPQEKMDRWISRLTQLRRRKLEGDAM